MPIKLLVIINANQVEADRITRRFVHKFKSKWIKKKRNTESGPSYEEPSGPMKTTNLKHHVNLFLFSSIGTLHGAVSCFSHQLII